MFKSLLPIQASSTIKSISIVFQGQGLVIALPVILILMIFLPIIKRTQIQQVLILMILQSLLQDTKPKIRLIMQQLITHNQAIITIFISTTTQVIWIRISILPNSIQQTSACLIQTPKTFLTNNPTWQWTSTWTCIQK